MPDVSYPAGRNQTGTTIGVGVCTYSRNEPLHRLLASLVEASDTSGHRAEVGVVVVDDNPDGRARQVVEGFERSFALGVCYIHSGRRNIATARNLAMEGASSMGQWVAMVDDDVVVPPDWFQSLLDVQERTGADAVTGPMHVLFPEGSASWLRTEPFGQIGALEGVHDHRVETCATSNTLLRSAWLRDHPEIRFEDAFGRLGGEDMVFSRRATAAGLLAHFSSDVAVHQLEPAERATLRYQLRRALWMGNSASVTNRHLGTATRGRLLGRGARRCLRAAGRVVQRARDRETLQLRYAAANMAEGLGMMLGAMGMALKHR